MSLLLIPILAHQKATGTTLMWKHYLPLARYILLIAVTYSKFPIYSCNELWFHANTEKFHWDFFGCKGRSSECTWYKFLVMGELCEMPSKPPLSHWPVWQDYDFHSFFILPRTSCNFYPGLVKRKKTTRNCFILMGLRLLQINFSPDSSKFIVPIYLFYEI